MDRTQWRTLVVSVLVAGLFLFLAFRNVPLADLWKAFERFNAWWLIPGLGLSLLLMVFRAWRWQLELLPLERIGLGRLWIVCSVAYMAINVLPVRLGEVVRPWLLSRRSSVSFSNVIGTLVVEKTMDSICIVFYILVGLLTATALPPWVRRGALFPAAAALLLAGTVVLVWWKGEPFVARAIARFLPERFEQGLMRITRAIIDGMRVLPNTRLLVAVFAVSLALWFLPILSSYIMMLAFGFEAPFNAALIVFIFIGFGTALPNAPGMIGTYQYACILALELFGIDKADALAYGLVLNALQLLSIVAQGVIALPLAGVTIADFGRARREAAAAEDAPG